MFTDEPDSVGVVDHNHGTILFGEVTDLRQRGNKPVHRENAVGGDHDVPAVLRSLQLGLKIGHVLVTVTEALGLAQPDPIDDRGMVKLVGNNRVVSAEKDLKKSAVGVKAGRVKNGVPVVGIIGVKELGDGSLELLVEGLGATNKPHRGHPKAPFIESPLGSLNEHRGISQTEVIIRAQVNDLAPIIDGDLARLGAGQRGFSFIQPLLLKGCDLGAEFVFHRSVHSCPSSKSLISRGIPSS